MKSPPKGGTAMKSLLIAGTAFAATMFLGVSAPAAGKWQPKYPFIQVKQLEVQQGVDLPPDYQVTIVEDLIKKLSKVKGVKQVFREGEALPEGQPVLLVTATVTKFKKGNQAERYLVGFGAGETLVETQLKCFDAATKALLLDQKVDGREVMGIMGGKSENASGGLAYEITDYIKQDFYSRDGAPPAPAN
jgi:hypothetical protein